MADLSQTFDIKFSIVMPIDTPETAGADKAYFPFAPAAAGAVDEVYLMVGTAPGTDKTFTVDVHKNGTTIFSTQASRPSITDTATEDASDTPDVTAFAKNDKFTVDVDVSTAGTAVADAVCIIRGTQQAK